MRLTCPNCGAQYEVPDEVIPSAGRDVQCSNCGHTWFQAHPDSEAEAEHSHLEAAVEAADTAAPAPEPDLEPEEPAPPQGAGPVPDAPPPDAETPARKRQELDSSVSEILRQEAEREAELRAAETGGLESQPELGLDSPSEDSARRAREARDRMARIRGEQAPAEGGQDAPSAARRDLLPDIEEINSTLRSSGLPAGAEPSAAPADEDESVPRRSGFLRGFSVALLIGAVLVLVYANAPRIARTLPQADPALSAYVAMIDQARLWFDAQLGDFVQRVFPD